MSVKQSTLQHHKSETMQLKRAWPEKTVDKQHNRQRRKLWQLQARFHCGVIGTCLTLDELQQLCRKANIVFETAVSDYELHSAFVNIAGQSGYPSRLLQKHLDSKYKRIIQQFRKIRVVDELPLRWQEAMKTGEVAGVFWTLLTHPCTSNELLDQMYGDIHMLSHLAGASVRVDMQALTLQHRRVENLEAQLTKLQQDSRRKLKEKDKTIQTISERMKQALVSEQRLQHAEQQKVKPKHDAKLPEMRKQIETLLARLASVQMQRDRAENSADEWKQFAIRSEDRNLKLEQALAEARQERDALEASLAGFLSENCRNACPQESANVDLDLCNRCVLYVGGRSRQHSHFRSLVEQYNGRFIHHDGGRENSPHQLGSMLPQADAVICPLDCVSHDAVRRVKQFCHRHSKKLVLLPRGSLSAFTRSLTELVS